MRRFLAASFAVGLLVACGENEAPPGTVATADGPTPVVVIVVDTLRADRLGPYDSAAKEITPELNTWAERGRVYRRAFATSPWTLPSFASIYTGHLPSRHAAGGKVGSGTDGRWTGLVPDLPTLAEVMQGDGKHTAAVVNNPFLSPDFGLARGFDNYDYVPGDNASVRRADEMVDRAVTWIDEQPDADLFLLLHLFDPHMDYDPPESVKGTFTDGLSSNFSLPIRDWQTIRMNAGRIPPEDRAFISAAYNEEVHAVDRELGRFLDALDRRGFLDHGLVVLTADHGEELFDHGLFEHGHAFWPEVIEVPMIVWGGGVRAGRERDAVSLVDVYPTVLDRLGLAPPVPVEGTSLWSNLQSETALPKRSLYAEFALYGNERKMALEWPDKMVAEWNGERVRLSNAAQDPKDRVFLTHTEPGDAEERMNAILQRARDKIRTLEDGVTAAPAEISPETLLRLQKLGYRD